MPEPTPTPTPTPTPDPAPAGTPPDDAPPGADASDREKRRWAALSGRVTQSIRERDEARQRIEQLLEREVLRVAATTLAEPSDVFLEGATIADLLDETGADVDPEKVKAVAAGIAAKRPGLLSSTAPRPISHGVRTPERKQNFAERVKEMTQGRI